MTHKVDVGRKFTAIDAHYQVLQATRMFGPCGQGWGTRNERFDVITADPTDPHFNLLKYQAELWYVHDGKEGRQEIAADIELFQNTRNGWKRMDDPVKKVRTDALTKGLSWLGFNADVFMGKFDDAKYVQQLKQEQAQQTKPPAGSPLAQYQAKGRASLGPPLPAAQNQRDDIDRLRKCLKIPGAQFTEWLTGYGYDWKTLSEPHALDVLQMLGQQLDELAPPGSPLAQQQTQQARALSAEFEADRAAGKV
jgi:hypothetical protein